VIKVNDVFADKACAVANTRGFLEDYTKPNGDTIAVCNPIGANGVIILVNP